jgi:hypothetical protein
LSTQLVGRDDQLSKQTEQIENLNVQHMERNKQFRKQTEQIESLNLQLGERDDLLRKLTEQIDGMHIQLNVLYSSTCWKITTPIRAIADFVKRIFRRGK